MLFVFTYFLNYLNLYPNYGYHRHALFFVMFIFIGNWLRKKNFIFEIKWILATLITYLLSTLFLFLGGYSTPSITGPLNVTSSDSIFFWLMLSFSGSITIVGICKLFDRNRVLQYIGKNSLVFYCFHLSFLKLSLGIKYLSDSYFFSLVYLLLILTVILGLCTLFSEMLNSKYGRYLLGKF